MAKKDKFADLVGKTLSKVVFRTRLITFHTSEGEEYTLGNDDKKSDYTTSIFGKLNHLVGLPILAATEEKKDPSIIMSLNNKSLNVCSDPRFPWGFYRITVSPTYKKEVIIRWFAESHTDFYSHRVQFKRIK